MHKLSYKIFNSYFLEFFSHYLFVTLLLGSIFTLIGTAGKDLISVVNFLVSDKNLNSERTVLLESAPSYLTRCISGDGNITDDLGLDLDAFKNLNQLMEAYTA